MNRLKKEQLQKHAQARQGLWKDEIAALDCFAAIQAQIPARASTLHRKRFPEESDSMGDTLTEAAGRKKGLNPMREEYIEQVNAKRAAQGVSPLSAGGLPTSNDSYQLCWQQAQLEIVSDLRLKRPPALECAGCDRPLRAVGGYRITAQKLRGTALSESAKLDSTRHLLQEPIQLFPDTSVFMTVWGEADLWTPDAIARARLAYTRGQKPWLCHCCAKRQCHACDAPVNYPLGSDIVFGNGKSSHIGMLGIDRGCSNRDCKRYRRWRTVPFPQNTKHVCGNK